MTEQFEVKPQHRKWTFGLAGIGILLVILGIVTGTDSHRIWASFITANWYFLGFGLAGTLIVAINYVSKAGWNTALKRVLEGMGTYVPFGALLFGIPFLAYMWFASHDHNIYHWMHEHLDALLQKKTPYLNLPFFTIRLIGILLIWVIFNQVLRKLSLKEDVEGGLNYFHRGVRISAVFLILFAITISVASWDWMMSLEPHWFSTIYGVYAFAGMFIGGWAVMTLTTIWLKNQGYLKVVTEEHYHDLGKFLFAFTVFWAYIWLSQFLLIWYANIPEETPHYLVRMNGSWMPIFVLNLILNFVLPFFILMMSTAKKNPKVLVAVCCIILVGRFVDIYQLVMPGALGENPLPHFGSVELGFMFLYGGIFIFTLHRGLANAPLLPKNHPLLDESLHHEVH